MWLAPEQVRILPLTEAQVAYGEALLARLREAAVRAELDRRSEKVGAKIRRARLEKVPYMLVAGPKEVESATVALRSRERGDEGPVSLEAFLERNPELRPEWKYYGPKNGWALKVFRKKRNMCFVGREPGAIAMGFVLGERAYDHLLTLDLRPALRETVEGAKRFPEGRGIRLILKGEPDLEVAQVLLEV